jgi:hypothetical protein
MIGYLVAVIVLYWFAAGFYAYRLLSQQMGRLSSYFRLRPDIPEKYKPFYRSDFAGWPIDLIMKNCFLTLPWKMFISNIPLK